MIKDWNTKHFPCDVKLSAHEIVQLFIKYMHPEEAAEIIIEIMNLDKQIKEQVEEWTKEDE